MKKTFVALSILIPTWSAFGATCVERFATDLRKADECKRAERRAEIRKVATPRLIAVSRATADFVRSANSQGQEIAVGGQGGEVAWCEEFLNDLLRLERIAVIDDERVIGPKWAVVGVNDQNRVSTEILDPSFLQTMYAGKPVIRGYVTVRWKQEIVVVAPHVLCSFHSIESPVCHPSLYASISVYSSASPKRCEASSWSKEYRRASTSPTTVIQLRLPGSRN
jgi:hypothetical protein